MSANSRHVEAPNDHLVNHAATLVARSDFIVALTGSSLSPTEMPPVEAGGATDENTLHRWSRHRRDQLKHTAPGPGHHALAELSLIVQKSVLITETIDGLHQKAGAGNVIELHGNVWFDACKQCGFRRRVADDESTAPDRCPHCRGGLRPAVIAPHDQPRPADFRAALEAVDRCDLILSVGISDPDSIAAALLCQAAAGGSAIVEIALRPTVFTPVAGLTVTGTVGTTLTDLVRRVRSLLTPVH